MNLIDYTLPLFWAPALINGDTSHMTDKDIAALDEWLAITFPNGGHCVDVIDDEHFSRFHDASEFVLACEVATFTFDA